MWPGFHGECVCESVIKQDCVWSLKVPGERLVSRLAVTERILKAKTCLIPVALVHLPLSKALFSVTTRFPSIAFVLNCKALILQQQVTDLQLFFYAFDLQ